MVAVEDAHVGSSPHASLLYHVGGEVEESHEGDRAGRLAVGGFDGGSFGSEGREVEAGASSAFMDDGLFLEGLEDGLHGVLDADDVACGQLPVLAWSSCVHEGGAVGQEVKGRHYVVESPGVLKPFLRTLRRCNSSSHTFQHLFRCFNDFTFLVFPEVTLPQNCESVLIKLWMTHGSTQDRRGREGRSCRPSVSFRRPDRRACRRIRACSCCFHAHGPWPRRCRSRRGGPFRCRR